MIPLATKRTRLGRLKDSSAKTGIPESKEIPIIVNIFFQG